MASTFTLASCSAVAFSSPVMVRPPPASRYGALAYAWSRSDSTSSFGDSGLPVFQAGHCDWQRPHSVQVVKSSRPFQVNCSTGRDAELILLRVGLLEVERRAVADIIGRSAPRAGRLAAGTLEEDVEEREEPVPGHAHRDVERDHDQPGHRNDDLDHRDELRPRHHCSVSDHCRGRATRARPRSGTAK